MMMKDTNLRDATTAIPKLLENDACGHNDDVDGSSETHVELVALDLKSCTRCVGSADTIEQAMRILGQVLQAIGKSVRFTRTVVNSEAEAIQHRLTSSPTIRVDGYDIVSETHETECESCTELCGCLEGTTCRVWHYRGKEFNEAPVGLIVEAILQSVVTTSEVDTKCLADAYLAVPDNLRRFFAGQRKQRQADKNVTLCCSPSEMQMCCEPAEKTQCCNESNPGSCHDDRTKLAVKYWHLG